MSTNPIDFDEMLGAAYEFIRRDALDGPVGIDEVIGALIDRFGERFSVSEDTWTILNLIHELWSQAEIRSVTAGEGIWFAWDGP